MQFLVVVQICKAIARDESGQDLMEYGLLAALIALVAIGAVTSVGDAINTFFWQNIARDFAAVV